MQLFSADTKGQIISDGFFGVFNFFKMNKNTSHSSRNEFICSFFWKKSQLDNLLSKLTDLNNILKKCFVQNCPQK